MLRLWGWGAEHREASNEEGADFRSVPIARPFTGSVNGMGSALASCLLCAGPTPERRSTPRSDSCDRCSAAQPQDTSTARSELPFALPTRRILPAQASMNLRERGMGSRLQRVQAAVLEQLDGLFLAESLLPRELGGVRHSQFVLQYHDVRPLPGIDTTRRHMKPRAVPYNKFRVGPGRTGWATPCGGTRGSRADSVRRLL